MLLAMLNNGVIAWYENSVNGTFLGNLLGAFVVGISLGGEEITAEVIST